MNTQNKTVELYNRNSDFYCNVEKFIMEQGYKNVCEYCADVFDKLGTVEWCTEQAKNSMYEQQEMDLEFIVENTLEYLDKNYFITVRPISERWNGIYKGELQNVNNIYDVLNYEINTITIKDNYLEIVTSHHDGNNTYQLYFADYSLYDGESEKHYMNTVINIMDLWERGALDI